MKTRIITLQFALFLRDIVERPDLEFSSLNSDMLNIFNAMPQMIPVPRELPADVPVVVLRSEAGEYTCNLSRSRVDFILTRVDEAKSNTDLLKDFNAKVAGLVKSLLTKQEVARFGMVARYFHADKTAASTLRKKFFSGAVDGAEELSLRYNKKSDAHGYKINDILEINAVEAVSNGVAEKGILIQRDINNDLIQDKHFDFDTLMKLSAKYAVRITENEVEGLIK